MKKKLIAAAFLCMTGGMANAATLANTVSVDANFTVVGGCSVSGDWQGNTISAKEYTAGSQSVGTLGITLTGCSSQVYFLAKDLSADGLPQATSPSGNKVIIMPDLTAVTNGIWSKDRANNAFYTVNALTDGQSVEIALFNRDKWTAEPGAHTMVLDVGTYAI
ncbi:Dr family adhesin structural subunit [Escherichia coli]|nr:Dr family adhesin structural subunit [Escherichia coli]